VGLLSPLTEWFHEVAQTLPSLSSGVFLTGSVDFDWGRDSAILMTSLKLEWGSSPRFEVAAAPSIPGSNMMDNVATPRVMNLKIIGSE
jgi:hypothetical protein